TTSEVFVGQPSMIVLVDVGVRAVISTPLMSSRGNLLGMISTHFREPHHPSERELRLLDILARAAALTCSASDRRRLSAPNRERVGASAGSAQGRSVMRAYNGSKVERNRRGHEILAELGRRFPRQFGIEMWESHRPLAIGIDVQLREWCRDIAD